MRRILSVMMDAQSTTPARLRELASLLPLWPKDLADVSPAGRRKVIALMERALRAERRRGQCGHWAYDLNRHAALLRAWKRERAELAAMQRSTPKSLRRAAVSQQSKHPRERSSG